MKQKIRKKAFAMTWISLLLFACPVSSQTITVPLTYLFGHPISIKSKPAKNPEWFDAPVRLYYDEVTNILTISCEEIWNINYTIYDENGDSLIQGLFIGGGNNEVVNLSTFDCNIYYIEIEVDGVVYGGFWDD